MYSILLTAKKITQLSQNYWVIYLYTKKKGLISHQVVVQQLRQCGSNTGTKLDVYGKSFQQWIE